MTEFFIDLNDARLCVETFGADHHPAILLMAGASASMLWWDADLCRRLAEHGRLVIRYDQRDTGRSTSYPRGEPDYSTTDLATDAPAFGSKRTSEASWTRPSRPMSPSPLSLSLTGSCRDRARGRRRAFGRLGGDGRLDALELYFEGRQARQRRLPKRGEDRCSGPGFKCSSLWSETSPHDINRSDAARADD